MSYRDQWLCLWCGPAFIVLMFVGFWYCAGFIPPSSPNLTTDQVVSLYTDRLSMIRLGLGICMLSAGLLVPFAGVITTQMRRIQGIGPTLAYTQLSAGGANVMVFVVPYLIFGTAAFRPERMPEITLALHDLGWVSFIMAVPLAIIQVFAFGAAVLMDKAVPLIFPRWLGYLSIWVGILFFPACIILYFRQGPFAWNGIFPFWIPLVVFCGWFVLLSIELAKAIKSQERGSS